jgi:hypothetical protein
VRGTEPNSIRLKIPGKAARIKPCSSADAVLSIHVTTKARNYRQGGAGKWLYILKVGEI